MVEIDIKAFARKKPVLFVAFILAVLSFALQPNLDAFEGIRYKVLGIMFVFMAAMAGLKACGVFESISHNLAGRTDSARKLVIVLVALPYIAAAFITNDVSLLVFVPLALTILISTGLERLIIPVLVLQTLAVNIGCMLTPFGNPHNLFVFTEYDLSFQDLFTAMLPYAIVGTVLIIAALMMIKDGEIPVHPEYEKREYSKVHLAIAVIIFAMGVVAVLGLIPYWTAVIVAIAMIAIVAPRDLLDVNYGMILTFVCLFILTGNISSSEALADFLTEILAIDPTAVTALVSQVTSNLPATVLLNGFTDDWYGLLVGSDIGGYGTPIASMAAIITMEFYISARPGSAGKYLKVFTCASVSMFLVLLGTHFVIEMFRIRHMRRISSTASENFPGSTIMDLRHPRRSPNSTSFSLSPIMNDLDGSKPISDTALRPMPISGFLHEQWSSGVWGQ